MWRICQSNFEWSLEESGEHNHEGPVGGIRGLLQSQKDLILKEVKDKGIHAKPKSILRAFRNSEISVPSRNQIVSVLYNKTVIDSRGGFSNFEDLLRFCEEHKTPKTEDEAYIKVNTQYATFLINNNIYIYIYIYIHQIIK